MPLPRTLKPLLLVATLLPAAALATTWKDILGAAQQAAAPQAGQTGGQAALASLSNSEIATGLKAALAQGTRTAVNTLGRSNGFWGNAAARIPLPAPIAKLERTARGLGLGAPVDQFHLSLNRAAEQAVPVAADVLAQSVQQLTLNDVRAILTGPSDAATQYFRRQTSATLTAKFRPLVARATAQVGVAQSYKQLSASAGPLATALGAPADLDGYVTAQALDKLFVQVAAEEARIRQNPAARGSAILKKVFGASSQ